MLSESLVIFFVEGSIGSWVHVHNCSAWLDMKLAAGSRLAGGRQAGHCKCAHAHKQVMFQPHAAQSHITNGMQLN